MNQMAWYSPTENGDRVLYINHNDTWLPYTQTPFALPDYLIPGGSKGYATMQFLLMRGYKIVSSEQVQDEINAIN